VPSLGSGHIYSVRYLNTSSDPNPGPDYLGVWLANKITTYAASATMAGGDFDVADIYLASPTDGARITLPASFCWNRRSVSSDNYRLMVYYPAADEIATTNYLGYARCVTITGLPANWPSGATYYWWVAAYKGTNPDATPYNFGFSYETRQAVINYTAHNDESGPGVLRRLVLSGRVEALW